MRSVGLCVLGVLMAFSAWASDNTIAEKEYDDFGVPTEVIRVVEPKREAENSEVLFPSCSDVELLKQVRAILDEGGNSGINENLVAKRARLLALKNVDKFESVEVDSFRPDMNYDVANILVSSKINDGLVNSDFAICVADNAVLDRKFYLVMKRKEDKISVLIVNYKRGVIPSFVYEN